MKRRMMFLAVAAALLGNTLCLVRAQNSEESSPEKPSAEKNAKPGQQGWTPQAYRLDFSFNELEDGKKINTRHYSLNLTSGSGNELKIGSRVPIATGENSAMPATSYKYMDVGTRIWASIGVQGGGELRLDVKSEVSNLDMSAGRDHPQLPPVVRQIQINGTTRLITAKPILIGSMDDPNSNRQFQLEMTATKLP